MWLEKEKPERPTFSSRQSKELPIHWNISLQVISHTMQRCLQTLGADITKGDFDRIFFALLVASSFLLSSEYDLLQVQLIGDYPVKGFML